jgi:hypothetical protein
VAHLSTLRIRIPRVFLALCEKVFLVHNKKKNCLPHNFYEFFLFLQHLALIKNFHLKKDEAKKK